MDNIVNKCKVLQIINKSLDKNNIKIITLPIFLKIRNEIKFIKNCTIEISQYKDLDKENLKIIVLKKYYDYLKTLQIVYDNKDNYLFVENVKYLENTVESMLSNQFNNFLKKNNLSGEILYFN